MTSRASYYRRRRRLLRKLHRCVRCGEFPAADGHSLCAVCLELKKLKAPDDAAEHTAQRKKRLAEIDALRARIAAGIGS